MVIVGLLIWRGCDVNKLWFVIVSGKMVVHFSLSDQVRAIKENRKNEDRQRTPHCRSDRLSGVRKRCARHASLSHKPETPVFVYAVVHMKDELRRGAGNALAMRHVIERPL